jgi:hypothetical protein
MLWNQLPMFDVIGYGWHCDKANSAGDLWGDRAA